MHAFQGRTVDNVIAATEANHLHLTTLKSFYVKISRARDSAELVTDDRSALKEQLEAATGERIAALEAIEPERAKGRGAAREVGRERSQGLEIGGPNERTPAPDVDKTRMPRSVDRDPVSEPSERDLASERHVADIAVVAALA